MAIFLVYLSKASDLTAGTTTTDGLPAHTAYQIILVLLRVTLTPWVVNYSCLEHVSSVDATAAGAINLQKMPGRQAVIASAK